MTKLRKRILRWMVRCLVAGSECLDRLIARVGGRRREHLEFGSLSIRNGVWIAEEVWPSLMLKIRPFGAFSAAIDRNERALRAAHGIPDDTPLPPRVSKELVRRCLILSVVAVRGPVTNLAKVPDGLQLDGEGVLHLTGLEPASQAREVVDQILGPVDGDLPGMGKLLELVTLADGMEIP